MWAAIKPYRAKLWSAPAVSDRFCAKTHSFGANAGTFLRPRLTGLLLYNPEFTNLFKPA